MTASYRSVVWAVPLAIMVALAFALARIPAALIARAVAAAIALGCLMLAAERVESGGRAFLVAIIARLLIASFLSGAILLLFVVTLSPSPSVANLLWMTGIPVLVALGQRRPNFAALVLTVVFAWVGFALLAYGLRVPID